MEAHREDGQVKHLVVGEIAPMVSRQPTRQGLATVPEWTQFPSSKKAKKESRHHHPIAR
jgi:hypothetical protein